MEIVLTNHALRRLEERMGVSSIQAPKVARDAFINGLAFYQVESSLQRYITKRYVRHQREGDIKLYRNFLFVFKELVLITVLNLPSEEYQDSISQEYLDFQNELELTNKKQEVGALQKSLFILRREKLFLLVPEFENVVKKSQKELAILLKG